jgi:hypothetical protein
MVSGREEEAIASGDAALEIAPESARRVQVGRRQRPRRHACARRPLRQGMADYALGQGGRGDDRDALLRYYVNTSDTLHLLGRFQESMERAQAGLDLARSAGVERTSGAPSSPSTPSIRSSRSVAGRRPTSLIDESLDLQPPAVFLVYLRRSKVRSTSGRRSARSAGHVRAGGPRR